MKYPRTPHLPFSKGTTSDDKILPNDDHLYGKEVVVTIKMDGENTSIYRDRIHARSESSATCSYHSWLKNFAATWQYMLPENVRVCGEYLYAQHSIKYDNLESYFMCFSIWDNTKCLSWEDTEKYAKELGLQLVPVVWYGRYNLDTVKALAQSIETIGGEGIVVRLAGEFQYEDFGKSIAKYVRPNHVQTDKHWRNSEIIPNTLKGG